MATTGVRRDTIEYKARSAECGVRSAECRVRGAKCGVLVQSASAECGDRVVLPVRTRFDEDFGVL